MGRTREELESQNLDELFERFRQAPDGYAFVPLADACRKMGRIDEALEICDAGVKKHPAYPSGHVVRGKCLFDRGNRTGAREAFERVLLLDEHNLVALKYLGMIEADDGNLSAAEAHLKKILSFDPENKEIKSILHLVEEQGQIERSSEAPATTMEAVDEILADVSPSPALEEEDGAEPEPALSIEGELGGEPCGADTHEVPVDDGTARGEPSRDVPRTEEVETSDELASVTLADIFAEQGYRSKAAKIYREVLRKQPANDAIRVRLAELTGEPVEPAEALGEQTTCESPELPEIAEPADSAGTLSEPAAATAGTEESAESARAGDTPGVTPPPAGGGAGPEGEAGLAAGPEAVTETAGRARAGRRPEIAEKESLNHFRHWLTKIRR